MINDVARACFEAPPMQNVCVGMPKEDLTDADVWHDRVGHLKMSLYGIRDAAMTWQEEVVNEMKKELKDANEEGHEKYYREVYPFEIWYNTCHEIQGFDSPLLTEAT